MDEDDLLGGAQAMDPYPHDLSEQVGRHGVRPSLEGHIVIFAATVRVTPKATVCGTSITGCSPGLLFGEHVVRGAAGERWTGALTRSQN